MTKTLSGASDNTVYHKKGHPMDPSRSVRSVSFSHISRPTTAVMACLVDNGRCPTDFLYSRYSWRCTGRAGPCKDGSEDQNRNQGKKPFSQSAMIHFGCPPRIFWLIYFEARIKPSRQGSKPGGTDVELLIISNSRIGCEFLPENMDKYWRGRWTNLSKASAIIAPPKRTHSTRVWLQARPWHRTLQVADWVV